MKTIDYSSGNSKTMPYLSGILAHTPAKVVPKFRPCMTQTQIRVYSDIPYYTVTSLKYTLNIEPS